MNDLNLQQWWTLSGDDFMSAMKRAANGEDPEMIYAEFYANSRVDNGDDHD